MNLIEKVRGLGRKIRELCGKLLSLKDTPHAIAGGVAIGVFMGFTPLFGLKTLLSLGLAYALRCNPIAAVIAVSLHDVVTPLWPVLLRIEYEIGYWILSNPHQLPPKMDFHHHAPVTEMLKSVFYPASFSDFMHTMGEMGKGFSRIGLPVGLGSLFFSIPSAAFFYALVLAILKRRARVKALHDADSPPGG